MRRRAWESLAISLATIFGALGWTAAVAGPHQSPEVVAAQSIQRVTVVTNDEPQTLFIGYAWSDIPNATAVVTVPSRWSQALVMARFVSDQVNSCDMFCNLQITVDGVVAHPTVSASWDSYPMPKFVERSLVVGPGAHVIQVQIELWPGPGEIQLLDWILTTELARVS